MGGEARHRAGVPREAQGQDLSSCRPQGAAGGPCAWQRLSPHTVSGKWSQRTLARGREVCCSPTCLKSRIFLATLGPHKQPRRSGHPTSRCIPRWHPHTPSRWATWTHTHRVALGTMPELWGPSRASSPEAHGSPMPPRTTAAPEPAAGRCWTLGAWASRVQGAPGLGRACCARTHPAPPRNARSRIKLTLWQPSFPTQ